MTYMKVITAFHMARAATVAAWVNANPMFHHVIILPQMNLFKIRDHVTELMGIKQRVDFCSGGSPLLQRRQHLDDLQDWMGRPEDSGYALIGSNLIYNGWSIMGDSTTRVRLSWVASFRKDSSEDAQIAQALGRFRRHGVMADVEVGMIPQLNFKDFYGTHQKKNDTDGSDEVPAEDA